MVPNYPLEWSGAKPSESVILGPLHLTRWPLHLVHLLSTWVLPLASGLFVAGYWVLGLTYYYTWPEMTELCLK